jgi:precorrin-2 dehydrogenase / sirohydrochlorin ferrochelatase
VRRYSLDDCLADPAWPAIWQREPDHLAQFLRKESDKETYPRTVSPRQQVYPISLLLEGRPCLVVGGGHVALSKISGLLDVGAAVTVIAPEVLDEITALPVTVLARPYQEGDCDGFMLVIAATGDRGLDASIYEECQHAATLVNAADNPTACTFYLPALFRAGDLSVAISTAGASPAIASWVRDRVGTLLGEHFSDVVDLVGAVREQIRASGQTSEGLPWGDLIDQLTSALAEGVEPAVAGALASRWATQVVCTRDGDLAASKDEPSS